MPNLKKDDKEELSDLNYGTIFPEKDDPDNLKKAEKNIQERFGLEQKGIPEGGE